MLTTLICGALVIPSDMDIFIPLFAGILARINNFIRAETDRRGRKHESCGQQQNQTTFPHLFPPLFVVDLPGKPIYE
jgi:hypothetical protein